MRLLWVLLSVGPLTRPAWAHDDEGRQLAQALAEAGASSWAVVEEILVHNCVTCHRAGTSFTRQSGLDLSPLAAYEALIGVAPQNRAGRCRRFGAGQLGGGAAWPESELFVGEDQCC